jgi:hypothetical protein
MGVSAAVGSCLRLCLTLSGVRLSDGSTLCTQLVDLDRACTHQQQGQVGEVLIQTTHLTLWLTLWLCLLLCFTLSGVRLSDGSTLSAQLVVDCSGRGSNMPSWLAAAGLKRPRTTRAGCDTGYAGW